MVASAEIMKLPGLDVEWARIDVLAQCMYASRRGQQADAELLEELKQLQNEVTQIRAMGGHWSRLPTEDLSPLALDILACIYVSEAYPKVGWMYLELQHGQQEPYATPALIQLLLALNGEEVQSLQLLIAPQGELQCRKLIEVCGDGPFAKLKPKKTALAKLLDWPKTDINIPGAVYENQAGQWQDLVLPQDRELMLQEFLVLLRHRYKVIHEWGGKDTGGPIVLFSGPSGTGKTYAASIIANELGWPLYKVDLSSLVSKYIGETEKNIGRLLDAAHGEEVVLQFDEADALMSKRGEVKEARDRYANMEVSYLLARIESHQGPCILTTNLRSQIDKAFSRRFQMVIEFPRPDFNSRKRLWQIMMPPRAPLDDDVDVEFLAGAVNLTGGNIRNAALHAAYLAAEDNTPLSLSHIAVGVWREMSKENQQLKKMDIGGLAAYLPNKVQAKAEVK